MHQWIDDKRAAVRLEAINNFEKLLTEDNETTILKFYLHLSHERQLEKLEERRIDPENSGSLTLPILKKANFGINTCDTMKQRSMVLQFHGTWFHLIPDGIAIILLPKRSMIP